MQIWVIDPRKSGKQQVYLFPRDYVTAREEKKLREQTTNIEDILDLIRVLRSETRPIEGHTDPNAIQDCWNELEDKIKEIK